MNQDFSELLEEFDKTVPKDSTTMKLAHPIRCPAAEPKFYNAFERLLPRPVWEEVQKQFKNQELLTSAIMGDLTSRPGFETLRRLVFAGAALPGGTEMGNVYANLLMLRHVVSPQPYFRIDDSLCSMLLETDLDDDIPLDAVKVPYPRFYLEFGSRRDLPLYVLNDMTGKHVLEGAYVEHGLRDNEEPGFYVMFTGSPLGKSNALDDATHSVFMPLKKEFSLKQALEYSYREGARVSAEAGFRPANPDTLPPSQECLNFLAKVLLYIGLPDARRSLHSEKSDWLKKHQGLKSPGKVAKAARKAAVLTDYILITASSESQSAASQMDQSRSTVKSHWRRGHYRVQRYGEKLSLSKLIHIAPTLVNAALLGSSPQTAPSYKVT